jgi:two-component system, OmpR family, response regulator
MGKHVLLIEDEPNIIEAITYILHQDGWRVTSHSDGTTALGAVQQAGPDLVILDVMLPGRSGFDILQDLRGDARTSALPILMLTAKGQTRDREAAEKFGASRYMTKPFSNSEMLDAVRGLIP